MKKNIRKEKSVEIKRYRPNIETGLTDALVEERKASGLINKAKHAIGKSYLEIIMTDVFSFFNILLFVIAGFMIYGKLYDGLFFLVVIIPNMFIGLYEDIKARILLGRLNLLTQPKAVVIRNGNKITLNSTEIVLDDVIYLNGEAQICVDGEIVSGEVFVNESALTGESRNILKKKGEKLYAGSYINGGEAIMRADAVGKECYLNQLQDKANKFRRSPSQILISLKTLFIVIGIIVVSVFSFTIAVYLIQHRFSDPNGFIDSIPYIAGSMVGMIPSGLYLLTSMTLAGATISLAKKKAQVQDFYSVEMLARTNVLCVDKTGTITDGTMVVKKLEIIDTKYDKDQIGQIIANIVQATKDTNATANALRNYFNYELTAGVVEALPFNSANKYSGASFTGGNSYVIGAAEFLPLVNKDGVIRRTLMFAANGCRVIVLAKTIIPFQNKSVIGSVEPIAIVVLDDHVKDDAAETFKWFADNDVEIKVISGDNEITVSEISKQAGINNADKYISLNGKSIEEVKELVNQYSVFGRVTPEQKEALVMSLKQSGKTVAMTGDGVNDILALKRADCSIAMASGSDAARNVSHIVLMDSNFSRLPDIVAEGRRVINNLQRTCSLFLVKTLFTITISIMFLIISLVTKDTTVQYPFLTNHLYVWEILGIGNAAFFISFQPNKERIEGKFLGNILRKAIPGGVMMILSTFLIFGTYYMCTIGGIPLYVDTMEAATSMAVITITLLSAIVLYKVCLPFDKYRTIVFSAMMLGYVVVLGGSAYLSFTQGIEKSILRISYPILTGECYFIVGIVTFLCAGLYLTITNIISICRGESVDED